MTVPEAARETTVDGGWMVYKIADEVLLEGRQAFAFDETASEEKRRNLDNYR
jgi:hypothetical protein